MRRRKRKGTWLPVGQFQPVQVAEDTFNNIGGQFWTQAVTVDVEGPAPTTVIFPLTSDEPQEGGSATINDPLSPIIGDEYYLRRIVGKVFLGYVDPGDQGGLGFQSCLVAAGFFVARAIDDGNGNHAIPIGTDTSQAEYFADYSPLAAETAREPWIWRRTWMFSDIPNPALSPAQPVWPGTNAFAPGTFDGPHIDAKTIRRVASDERLWFACSAVPWPPNQEGANPPVSGQLFGHLDYRLFGSLTKARNRGVF